MARAPRLALAGELHLVALRGHNGSSAFVDDLDRERFVAMARQAAKEQGVAIHAYALAGTQVQWLATPDRDEALARWMQSLGRRYGAAFNLRHARRGTLWDGRFRSCVIEATTWLLDATVVVERLPQTEGLADSADQWPWSSAQHHLGRVRDLGITEHQLYWRLGNTPFERESAHAHILSAGVSAARKDELAAALRRGAPLGRPSFVADIGARTGRSLTTRPRGRPKYVPN